MALTAPGNSFAEADWHFNMNQPYQVNGTPQPLVLIQRIELKAPTGFIRNSSPLNHTIVYYEEIGIIPAGQTQTAAGVNDTWFAPPPRQKSLQRLRPSGPSLFRFN